MSVISDGNDKAMELQAAMEILAEVFGARPAEVEEMIQRRLEERSWAESQKKGFGQPFKTIHSQPSL